MVESVYSAVRTDSLYKADYVSSLKGTHGRKTSKGFANLDADFRIIKVQGDFLHV